MEKFERLEKEISDLCKDKKIQFRWTNCYYNEAYKFEFKKDNQRWDLLISKEDIYNLPYQANIKQVEAAIGMFDKDSK